jgi:hypothetical protein
MKALTLLAFLTILLFPIQTSSGVVEEQGYWVCQQVGTMEKSNTLAVSDVFYGKGTVEEKEVVFEKAIKKVTEGIFQPSFEPRCVAYPDKKKAQKRLDKDMKKAKKRKFKLFRIIFSSAN